MRRVNLSTSLTRALPLIAVIADENWRRAFFKFKAKQLMQVYSADSLFFYLRMTSEVKKRKNSEISFFLQDKIENRSWVVSVTNFNGLQYKMEKRE